MDQDRVISLPMPARFARALLRHLWLIVGVVALALAVVAALTQMARPPYQAEAWLLVKTGTSATQVTAASGDLDSMATLLTSTALEARVLADPQIARLPAEERQPGVLVRAIDLGADTRADLTTHVFKIAATQATAPDAVLLANAWADQSVAFLNQYYLAGTADLPKLQARARADYDQAEQAYQDFLATNSIPALQAQVTALEQSMTNYAGARSDNETGVYLEQLRANQQSLADQYALQARLQVSLGTAQALRTAVAGAAAPQLADSVALAALLTTASSLVPTGTLPVQVQVSSLGANPPPTRDQQLQTLDALLAALQARLQTLQAGIARASQEIGTTQPYTLTAGTDPLLGTLVKRDQELNRQLEGLQATRQQLEGRRDLAWENYQGVSKRLLDVNQGLSSLNRADEVVRAQERLATRPATLARALLSTLAVSLAGMILLVLLFELIAPGRQLAREIARWRPGRRPAPSPR